MTQPLFARLSEGDPPVTPGDRITVAVAATIDQVLPGAGGAWAWGRLASGHPVRFWVADADQQRHVDDPQLRHVVPLAPEGKHP